jgi:hypothetical protein
MRKLPALATAVVLRLGPQDESFVGDLVEEYESGRSRAWYWREALSAALLTSVRQIGARPARAFAAILTGWGTSLLLFLLLGDRTANGLAGWLWNWDRQTAYETGVWWPFWITASLVSYSGFGLSALAVVRLYRPPAGPMLMAYAASMLLGLIASSLLIEVLTRRTGAVPVPHTLFYVVSVALPHCWRAGLLLAPMIILVAGLCGCPSSGEPASPKREGGSRQPHPSA